MFFFQVIVIHLVITCADFQHQTTFCTSQTRALEIWKLHSYINKRNSYNDCSFFCCLFGNPLLLFFFSQIAIEPYYLSRGNFLTFGRLIECSNVNHSVNRNLNRGFFDFWTTGQQNSLYEKIDKTVNW